MVRKLFLVFLLARFSFIFSCEDSNEELAMYPIPCNEVEIQIDDFLQQSEQCLFEGDFENALTYIERAEFLLSLTRDENDHRQLRSVFDKAVLVTCIEGPSDSSYVQFAKLNALLATKSCNNKLNMSKNNLFDQNGHWPILGEEVISIEECLERVGTVEKSLEISCAALKTSVASRVAIEAAIYILAKQARQCCTQHGFWKTCIQPVVDTWKKVELLGIPPDPSWD